VALANRDAGRCSVLRVVQGEQVSVRLSAPPAGCGVTWVKGP